MMVNQIDDGKRFPASEGNATPLVRVSQASREDAKGIRDQKVFELRNSLSAGIVEKRTIETKLADFSPTKYKSAQLRIRLKKPGSSGCGKWIEKKGKMDVARIELVKDLQAAERHIAHIRDVLRDYSVNTPNSWDDMRDAVLETRNMVRELLRIQRQGAK